MTLMSMLEEEICSQDFENLLTPDCLMEDVYQDHVNEKSVKTEEIYTSVPSPEISDSDFEMQAYGNITPKLDSEYNNSLFEIDNFLSDWDSL